jgi:hypothetical protein
MAARWLLHLGGHPSTLSLGVKRSDREAIEAHAWLMSAGQPVVGVPSGNAFRVMCGDKERLVAATDQVSTTLDDEVVVLNLSTGTYFGLNEVGNQGGSRERLRRRGRHTLRPARAATGAARPVKCRPAWISG